MIFYEKVRYSTYMNNKTDKRRSGGFEEVWGSLVWIEDEIEIEESEGEEV